jgi:hypothetical protein
MKFFLTIYVCSVMCHNNVQNYLLNKHDYDRFYDTHYECVQKGLR